METFGGVSLRCQPPSLCPSREDHRVERSSPYSSLAERSLTEELCLQQEPGSRLPNCPRPPPLGTPVPPNSSSPWDSPVPGPPPAPGTSPPGHSPLEDPSLRPPSFLWDSSSPRTPWGPSASGTPLPREPVILEPFLPLGPLAPGPPQPPPPSGSLSSPFPTMSL